MATTCKLWIDGKRKEAAILAEVIRRIITCGYLNRIQPSLIELEILAAAFVRFHNGDPIISKGKDFSRCFPWSLICHICDKYLVRLIVHRCVDVILPLYRS